MTRIEKLPEFDCIEDIYNKHFELTAEEMKDRDSSPELKRMSIAEQSLLQRSIGSPPAFNKDIQGMLCQHNIQFSVDAEMMLHKDILSGLDVPISVKAKGKRHQRLMT
jgi:hypothetical protein